MPEQQLLTPGDLLDANGALAQAGYATAPVRRYRRGAVRANPLRIKEWDYYCIADDTAVLALTIADNGYMGLCSATLIDLPMLHPVPQDDKEATYAAKIDKREARIDFHRDAEFVERQVRAFAPAPGAFFEIVFEIGIS